MTLLDIIALSLCFICLVLASITPLIAKWFKLGDEGMEEEEEYTYEQYKKPEPQAVQIEMQFEE